MRRNTLISTRAKNIEICTSAHPKMAGGSLPHDIEEWCRRLRQVLPCPTTLPCSRILLKESVDVVFANFRRMATRSIYKGTPLSLSFSPPLPPSPLSPLSSSLPFIYLHSSTYIYSLLNGQEK